MVAVRIIPELTRYAHTPVFTLRDISLHYVSILNQLGKTNFCVLGDEHLKYSDYIEKHVSGRQCNISFMAYEGNYLKLTSLETKTLRNMY
jgi:hypothetical protein